MTTLIRSAYSRRDAVRQDGHRRWLRCRHRPLTITLFPETKASRMKPILILLSLLMGGQAITSLAAYSSPKRDTAHSGRKSTAAAKHRIVFQVSVDGQEQWQGVLANVENLQKEFGPRNTQVEVVCFGKGVDMLLNTDAPLAERIAKDHAAGVTLRPVRILCAPGSCRRLTSSPRLPPCPRASRRSFEGRKQGGPTSREGRTMTEQEKSEEANESPAVSGEG